jgi:hypothetical protein
MRFLACFLAVFSGAVFASGSQYVGNFPSENEAMAAAAAAAGNSRSGIAPVNGSSLSGYSSSQLNGCDPKSFPDSIVEYSWSYNSVSDVTFCAGVVNCSGSGNVSVWIGRWGTIDASGTKTLLPGVTVYPQQGCDGSCVVVPNDGTTWSLDNTIDGCPGDDALKDASGAVPIACGFSGKKNGTVCNKSDIPAPSPYVAPGTDPGTDPGTGPGPGTGTCSNGATDYPTCTTPGGGGSGPGTGTCANGATDYPTCTTPGGSGNGTGGGSCGGPGQSPCEIAGPSNTNEIHGADPDQATKGAWEKGLSDILDCVTSRCWNDTATDAQSQFVDNMSGWFDPIPDSSCTGQSYKIAGHIVTIEPCDVASRISEILGYSLWIYLLAGTLVQLTGGRKS